MERLALSLPGGRGIPRPPVARRPAYVVVRADKVPALVRWSFLLFMLSLPLDALDVGLTSTAASFPKVAGFLLFACCLIYAKRCFSHPPRALLWFLVYILVYVLSAPLIPAEFMRPFVSQLFRLMQLIALFWMASKLFRDESLARHALLAFSLATSFIAVGAMLGIPGLTSGRYASRMTTLDLGAGTAAILMALAGVTLIGLRLNEHVEQRWYKNLLIPLVFPLLAFSMSIGSRAGILAFVFGVAMYLLPYRKTKRRRVILFWALIVIIGMVYLAATNPVASARWQKTIDEGHTSGRDKIFAGALQMISEKPILGWQPIVSSYELAKRESSLTGEWRGERRAAHNLLLHLLIEVGLVGTIPFLVGLWLCIRAAWKGRMGSLRIMPFALTAIVLVVSMAQTGINNKLTWLVLALATAAPPSPSVRRKSPPKRVLGCLALKSNGYSLGHRESSGDGKSHEPDQKKYP